MIDDDDLNVEIIIEDEQDSLSDKKSSNEEVLSIFNKTFIGVPIFHENKKVGEETREIGKCSGKEMLLWAIDMLPEMKSLNYYPSDFEDRKKKEELFLYVLGVMKSRGVFNSK